MISSIDVVQLGARMHYAVPAFFAQNQVLNHFYTDIWRDQIPFSSFFSRLQLFQAIQSRFNDKIISEKVTSFPFFGLSYARALRKTSNREEETQAFLKFGNDFQHRILSYKKTKPAEVLYAFNSVAKELFTSKKYASSFKILEQTLAPRATEFEILEQEYQSFGLSFSHGEFGKKYAELELEECSLADLIVTGSDFVKQSLIKNGISAQKISVVPYGFTPSKTPQPSKKKNDSLNVLFVGNGGIRKGIRYAIEALNQTKNVNFSIVGLMEPEIFELPHSDNIRFLGSVSRTEIEDLFLSHDVLLLPSLCEGSATVAYEAMAYGLPVICTPNSGSVVSHNKDGWLIPIRNKNAISDVISILLNHPDQLENAQLEALKTAKNYTVEQYGQRLLNTIQQSLKS